MASWGSKDFDEAWFLKKNNPPKVSKDTPVSNTSNKNNINPNITRNKQPFQRIDQIAGLLDRTGLPTIWEQSTPCPCINPETNSPRSDCPLCFGKGLIYRKKYQLNIAFQSDDKGLVSNQYGQHELGQTIATPQITENGIENGIAVRDRLTVQGITLAQSYIVNITQDKFDNGILIPYLVTNFDQVITIDQDYNLFQLREGIDYTYDENTSLFKVLTKQLIGKNISMNISTKLRYYVANILKETRNAQVNKVMDKEMMMGNGNQALTNYIDKYNTDLNTNVETYRLPKKLLLKREDLFVRPTDFSSNGTNQKHKRTNPYAIDSKTYDTSILDELMEDDQ